MGEIVGGIIVMGLFIAFVMWKGRNSEKATDAERRLNEEAYWSDKENQGTGGLFSFGAGSSGDDDGDDGDD